MNSLPTALLALLAIALLIFVGWLLSLDRRAVSLRTVGGALALQAGIGGIALYLPLGRRALESLSSGVGSVIGMGRPGSTLYLAILAVTRLASCLPSMCCRS
jgi:CNT family concentrative nucleoside transporter